MKTAKYKAKSGRICKVEVLREGEYDGKQRVFLGLLDNEGSRATDKDGKPMEFWADFASISDIVDDSPAGEISDDDLPF